MEFLPFKAVSAAGIVGFDGTIEAVNESGAQWVWHKKCIHSHLKIFLQPFANLITGDFDGKDRRRRHENGQGKRSQVC